MPGLHGENKIIHADGSETPIDRAGGEIARDGDVLYFRAPGGGGYGDPLDRDLDYLQHDMDIGLVSTESARRDYGAVVDEGPGSIDRAATEANRAKLKERMETGPDLHRPEDTAVRPQGLPHRAAWTKQIP